MIKDVTNSPSDWEDFWFSPEKYGTWGKKEITLEQYQAAQELIRQYERQCNLKEQAYYDARVKLDAETSNKSKYYYEYDRNDPNRSNPFKK